jgi:hypothetical protein
MLRNRKLRSGLRSLFVLTILSTFGTQAVSASDDVPNGYKVDRYQQVWERNPFTLVTPAAAVVQPKPFDKFVLLSWLNDGSKDVVFVENTETKEVQKVTKEPNSNSLRLVAIHKDPDPKKAEVVLSNGTEEGSVKFRVESVVAAQGGQGGQQPPTPTAGVQNQGPGAPAQPLPGMPRQAQMSQNAQQALQQAARFGATQLGTGQMQPDKNMMPPRASEVRRKRITPPPAVEQQVGAPAPAQNISNQPQTQ